MIPAQVFRLFRVFREGKCQKKPLTAGLFRLFRVFRGYAHARARARIDQTPLF